MNERKSPLPATLWMGLAALFLFTLPARFYQALKLRKIDTALVRVPNASHDISARPSLLIDKVAYVLAWLKTHDVKAP